MLHRTRAALAGIAMLVAAEAQAGAPASEPTPVRVERAGTLDRSFGDSGEILSPPTFATLWEAVAVQAGGEIVVAGGAADDLVIARYHPDGSLDGSFGSGGAFVVPLPNGGRAHAVALSHDGHIVVAGMAYDDPAISVESDVVVVRLDPDGHLDRAFHGGIVTIDLGGIDTATAVAPHDGGRIVVLAETHGRMADVVLLGLEADGGFDAGFGDGGRVGLVEPSTRIWSVSGLTTTPNGDFVAVVTSFFPHVHRSEQFRLVRVDRDGSSARASADFVGFAGGVAPLRDDDRVIVSGAPGLLRILRDGSLDPTFGSGGMVATGENPGPILIDGAGRILTVSSALRRYFSDGFLDERFGDGGVAENSAARGYRALALQADDKAIAAGGSCEPVPFGPPECYAMLARYEADGTQRCGDADRDETVSVTDGVAALRTAAGLSSLCDRRTCDVDGSGLVTVTDGVNVLRAAADLPAALTCAAPLRAPWR